MKNLNKYIVLCLAVVLGFFICCCCCCKKGDRIAVVDVQKIVGQSRPVAELRQDMQIQMNELQAWVSASNAEIEKAKEGDKEALTQKYQAELQQKQQNLQKAQAEKLQQIDADITKLIEKVAKEEGFTVTLVKTTVATGGTDITDKVIAKLAK